MSTSLGSQHVKVLKKLGSADDGYYAIFKSATELEFSGPKEHSLKLTDKIGSVFDLSGSETYVDTESGVQVAELYLPSSLSQLTIGSSVMLEEVQDGDVANKAFELVGPFHVILRRGGDSTTGYYLVTKATTEEGYRTQEGYFSRETEETQKLCEFLGIHSGLCTLNEATERLREKCRELGLEPTCSMASAQTEIKLRAKTETPADSKEKRGILWEFIEWIKQLFGFSTEGFGGNRDIVYSIVSVLLILIVVVPIFINSDEFV